MGLFDVAAVVLAVGVCASLGLLAWTLGVGSAPTIRRARREVSEARLRLAATEGGLRAGTAVIHEILAKAPRIR
ncbi:MAG: hypothetical protein ABJB65_01685 [Chloroflexota bacterium]